MFVHLFMFAPRAAPGQAHVQKRRTSVDNHRLSRVICLCLRGATITPIASFGRIRSKTNDNRRGKRCSSFVYPPTDILERKGASISRGASRSGHELDG